MSYDAAECGPYGITLSQELERTMHTGSQFSEWAWQNAKQEGCHYACPERKLPSWPPCGQFIYPTLQKDQQTVLGAHQYDPDLNDCPEAAPWQTNAPAKNSLTCAMTRANKFLNAQPKASFDYSNIEQDSDMATQVAQSILRGQIPMNASEQYFGNGQLTNSSMQSHEESNNAGVLSEPEYSLRNLLPCVANTWTGIAYDMAHYDELPVNNDDIQKKMEYVFVRDDRWKYVVTTGLLFLFVILVIAAIISTSVGMSPNTITGVNMGGKVIDLSKLGIDNLEDMQIIIRPKK